MDEIMIIIVALMLAHPKDSFRFWIHVVDYRFSEWKWDPGFQINSKSLLAFRIPSAYLRIPKSRIPVFMSKNILDSGFHKQIPKFYNRTTL